MWHMGDFVTLRIGPKNRIVLPASLRDQAEVGIGSELVGHVDERGRIVLETPDSVRARVWDFAPQVSGDSMADIAAARSGDVLLDRHLREGSAKTPTAGAASSLLSELGL